MNDQNQYDERLVKLAQDLGSDRVRARVHNTNIYSQFDCGDEYGINGRRPSLDNDLNGEVAPEKE